MSDNILKLNIDGSEIRVISDYNNEDNDYICLTDIANKFGSQEYIKNWQKSMKVSMKAKMSCFMVLPVQEKHIS